MHDDLNIMELVQPPLPLSNNSTQETCCRNPVVFRHLWSWETL